MQEYRTRLGLLERVVNGAGSGIWETPQVGVEYLDGMYKGQQAYTMNFAATIGTAGVQVLLASSAWTRIISQEGWMRDATTSNQPINGYASSAVNAGAFLTEATGAVDLYLGTERDDVGDSYDVTLRYLK